MGAQEDSLPCTLASVSPWSALLATEACSWDVSTPSQGSTHTRAIRESWELSRPSQLLRLRSPSVQEPHTPSILFADAFRCSRRSHQRSTCTRAQATASRRLPRKRGWHPVYTRGSWRTS